MDFIRVTKEFHFEMAHALYGYDGPCRNIHGHSYSFSITVTGKITENDNNPKNGMVIDFSDLKKVVQSAIIEKFDHALILNGKSPHREIEKNKAIFEKIVLVDFQPTCENLLLDMVKRLKNQLPENVQLHHLRLRETPSSYAEWYAEDNKKNY